MSADTAGDTEQDVTGDERTAGVPSSAAHVTKVVGAPGSGKTVQMFDLAENAEHRKRGTSPTEMRFVTFTTAAQNEAGKRFIERFGVDANTADNCVRTFHSEALSVLMRSGEIDGLRYPPDDVAANGLTAPDAGWRVIDRQKYHDAELFEHFFNEVVEHPTMWPFDAKKAQQDSQNRHKEGKLTGENVPAGNQLLAIDDYVRACDLDLAACHHAPGFTDLERTPAEIASAIQQWCVFKEDWQLMQFGDFIRKAIEGYCLPSASVLFVDEFQDLSPLEYKLYQMWRDSPAVERVYIAGDPHQSLYGFRGGTPAIFNVTHYDELIRNEESRRCASAIIAAAKPVAARGAGFREHDVANVTAERNGGRVEHATLNGVEAIGATVQQLVAQYGPDGTAHVPETEAWRTETVFVLARTNNRARKLAGALEAAGVPYTPLKPPKDDPTDLDRKEYDPCKRWRGSLGAILGALRSWRDSADMKAAHATALLTHLSDDACDAGHDLLDDRAEAAAREHDAGGVVAPPGAAAARTWTPDDYRTVFRGIADRPADLLVADGGYRALDLATDAREALANTLRGSTTHDPEVVKVGTIHAAKGLECDAALLDATYTAKQKRRYERHPGYEAEERRVYYVGLTRAREAVVVGHGFGGETAEFPPLSR